MGKSNETNDTEKKSGASRRYSAETLKRFEELGFKLVEDNTSYVLPIWSPDDHEHNDPDDEKQAEDDDE
jgi:hypothetical protein